MATNKNKFIWLGLLAIAVVYSLYNIFFVYTVHYEDIPRKVRHVSRLLSIVFVYVIGYYSLKKYGVKWLGDIWGFIYIAVVTLLVLIGIYDWALGPSSMQLRNVAKTFHEFLISPVLFVAIVIFSKALDSIDK